MTRMSNAVEINSFGSRSSRNCHRRLDALCGLGAENGAALDLIGIEA